MHRLHRIGGAGSTHAIAHFWDDTMPTFMIQSFSGPKRGDTSLVNDLDGDNGGSAAIDDTAAMDETLQWMNLLRWMMVTTTPSSSRLLNQALLSIESHIHFTSVIFEWTSVITAGRKTFGQI